MESRWKPDSVRHDAISRTVEHRCNGHRWKRHQTRHGGLRSRVVSGWIDNRLRRCRWNSYDKRRWNESLSTDDRAAFRSSAEASMKAAMIALAAIIPLA